MCKGRSRCLTVGQETGGKIVFHSSLAMGQPRVSLAALSCHTRHSTVVPSPSRGPRYHLLAHTTLTLAAVQDGFRTHDLTLASHGKCVCVCKCICLSVCLRVRDTGTDGRGHGIVPISFPILTWYFLLPQRRTLPGCLFMVACVVAWRLSLSA